MSLCPAFRVRGPDVQDSLLNEIRARVAFEWPRKPRKGQVDPANVRVFVDALYGFFGTPCRPEGSRRRGALPPSTACHRSDHKGQNCAAGMVSSHILEHQSPSYGGSPEPCAFQGIRTRGRSARMEDDRQRAGGAHDKEARMALFRAFVATDDGIVDDTISGGTERRLYMLRHYPPKGGYSGSLVGHAEVRPRIENGRLAISLNLVQKSYYSGSGDGFGTIIATGGSRNAWLHHAYVVEPGKLIQRVTLRREGRVIPMVEGGRKSRRIVPVCKRNAGGELDRFDVAPRPCAAQRQAHAGVRPVRQRGGACASLTTVRCGHDMANTRHRGIQSLSRL